MFVLLDAIHSAYSRPEYQPRENATYCNQFVSEICESLGFHGFNGMLANQIADALSSSFDWAEVPLSRAQELANTGTLVVAAKHGEVHGHVNVICPGKLKTSGRWGAVPTVANVGKENFIGRGINWAFSDLPKLYAWRTTL